MLKNRAPQPANSPSKPHRSPSKSLPQPIGALLSRWMASL